MRFWPILFPLAVFSAIGCVFWIAGREEPMGIRSTIAKGRLSNLKRVVSIMMSARAGFREVDV